MPKREEYFQKRVKWDGDDYKARSTDDCIICLTEQQVYLVGQIIKPLTWSNTRWVGDISGLDFKDIAGNLEYRLAERMTCETLTLLAEQVTNLASQITNLTEIVQNLQDTVNQMNITIDGDTTIGDVFDSTELARPLGGDNECDNDVIWGGIVELVNYFDDQNKQFLGKLVQDIGNSADVLADAISAVPFLGALPFDEGIGMVNKILENIYDEYNTITDEDFLNTVKCDLFCLVSGDSPCDISIDILIDWVNAHNALTIDVTLTRIADIASFVINGTFISDEAFWAMMAFQLYIVSLDENFLVAQGLGAYEIQLASGYNTPDADWSILCEECPEYPSLVIGRCQDALVLGTATQIDENHWSLASQQHTDNNYYCMIRDTTIDAASTFKILEITNVVHASGSENGSQTYATCQTNNVFSWTPGMIGALNRYEYMFSSNVAFSFDIEVSQIGV